MTDHQSGTTFSIDRSYDIVSDRFSYRLRFSNDKNTVSSEVVYVDQSSTWKSVLAQARKLRDQLSLATQ